MSKVKAFKAASLADDLAAYEGLDPVVEGEDLVPVTDIDFLSALLPETIRLGQEFCKIMERHDYPKLVALGNLKDSRGNTGVSGIRKMAADFRSSGERALKPLLQERFPKHAIFFSHGYQASDAFSEEQFVLSSEAFLIHLVPSNSEIEVNKVFDPYIYIALLRKEKPVHGICHVTSSGTTAVTLGGMSITHNNTNPNKWQGSFESSALHVRDYYRKNGFPPELKTVRKDDFFKDIDKERITENKFSPASQILEVAAGNSDRTTLIEARLIEIAAVHAILAKAGGCIIADGDFDYLKPYDTVKCIALSRERAKQVYQKALHQDRAPAPRF